MTRTSTENELLSDDPFYVVVGNSIQGSYIPASAGDTTGGSTAGSVMSVTAGGITINLILDAAAQAAPASFKNGLQQAVAILAANITDQITVNIKIDYSGTGGGASAGPDNGYYENYSWVRSQLLNNASAGDTTFNGLPSGSTIQGQSNVAVWNAQLKLWDVIAATDTTTDDASAKFSTDINPNLLVGVALHELTHAMGRVPYGSAPDIFDFYRFTSPDVRLFSGNQTAPAAYFSLDGGVTKLADYGRNSDPSDFLNTGVQGPNDPFNEYYTSSTIQGLTSIDLKQLDALGFHLAINSPTTIEAVGTTSLVQAGSNYFMNPTAAGGGPSLKYGGTSVVVGQFSPFAPIAAEQTGSGYEIAWKYAAGNQFSIWNTDASGNYQSYVLYSSSSASLQSLETSFHQDLNGDGVIGIPGQTVLESSGTTALVQSGANYFFNPVAGGSGPELKFQGANVTDGQFSPFVPVAVEQLSGGGYQLAWKYAAADQFSIWNVDANGNYVSYAVYSANSIALETLETSFHQDLNGDGTTGFPGGTPLETAGATALVQSGSNFLFYPSAGGAGTLLKFQGAAVSSEHFAPFVPVGVEQTSSGYQLAWRDPGTNQFSIWTTDANGNYQSYTVYSSTSSGLKALETSFHQDLNGDGVTGPSPVQPLNTSRLDNFLFKATGSVDAAAAYQHLDSLAAGVGSHDVLQVTLDTFVQAGANDLNIGTTDIADWARHFLESHAGDLFAR